MDREHIKRLDMPFVGIPTFLRNLMYGQGGYQSSDLVEMNYANIATAMGCNGIRVEDPDRLAGAIASGLDTHDVPTVVDVVVTPGARTDAARRRQPHGHREGGGPGGVTPGPRPPPSPFCRASIPNARPGRACDTYTCQHIFRTWRKSPSISRPMSSRPPAGVPARKTGACRHG